MKIKLLSFLMIALFAFGLSACSELATTKKKAEDAASEVVGDGSGEEEVVGDVSEELAEGEISSATATTWVNAYQGLDGSTKVPCGHELASSDLHAILQDQDFNNEHDIFAMHAYDASTTTFHLVFCLKTTASGGASSTYRYFDFTKPCPKYCPGFSACSPCNDVASCDGAPTKSDTPDGYWFGRADMNGPLQAGLASSAYLLPDATNWGGDVFWYVCSAPCTTQPEAMANFQPCGIPGAPACPTF